VRRGELRAAVGAGRGNVGNENRLDVKIVYVSSGGAPLPRRRAYHRCACRCLSARTLPLADHSDRCCTAWSAQRVFDWLKARSTTSLARVLRRVYVIAIVVLFSLYIPIGAAAFATDVAIINGEMVAVAQWLDRNTQPDALIAAHDIGAIGYFARRPILDLAGLISPEVVPFIRDEAKLGEWIRARGARYLVTFPGWYPQLSSSPDLSEAFRGRSDFSSEHMTVYSLGR
jgi:hypothetical protein